MTEEAISSSTTSNVEQTEDNSLSYEEQVSDILDGKEPEVDSEADEAKTNEVKEDVVENKQENQEEKQDAEEVKVPDKFKNPDGSVNLKNLVKSYSEAEQLFNEKAKWEKERASLLEQTQKLQEQKEQGAKNKGYSSYEDMELAYITAQIEANEYAKYLQYTDNPEQVRQMLVNYIQNPSESLMKEIEIEFGSDINKRVAALSERQKILYEQQRDIRRQEAERIETENNAKRNIDIAVQNHAEMFEIEPFKNLFIQTLQRYGNNFTPDDAEVLINSVIALKDYFQKEFSKSKENNDALNKISNIAPSSSAKSYSGKDLDDMTDSEYARAVRELL